jgi:hypothetical protein
MTRAEQAALRKLKEDKCKLKGFALS